MAGMGPVVLSFLHGFALASIQLFAILAGFGVHSFIRLVNQIAIQLPVAVLVSVGGFFFWIWFLGKANLRWLNLISRKGLVGTLLVSFIWAPALFIPLHYFTQGYLTSLGNILAIWSFQAPVNIIIYFLLPKVNLLKIQKV